MTTADPAVMRWDGSAASTTCRCGLPGLGACGRCGQPMCGRHHVDHSAPAICSWCAVAELRPAREAFATRGEEGRRALASHLERTEQGYLELLSLPAATDADLIAFLGTGGTVDPATWSLAHRVRIEPVPWPRAAAALRAAGIPTYTFTREEPRRRWARPRLLQLTGWIANGSRGRAVEGALPTIRVHFLLTTDGRIVDGSGAATNVTDRVGLQALVYLGRYGSGTLPFPDEYAVQFNPHAPDAYYFGLNHRMNARSDWLRLLYRQGPEPYVEQG